MRTSLPGPDFADLGAAEHANRLVGLNVLDGQDSQEGTRAAIDDLELHALLDLIGRADRDRRPLAVVVQLADLADHAIDRGAPGLEAGDGCVGCRRGP